MNVIDMCLNCEQEECTGSCDRYLKADIQAQRKQEIKHGHARMFDYEGETLTLAQIASQVGISDSLLQYRLKLGMTLEDAVALGRKRKRKCNSRTVVMIDADNNVLNRYDSAANAAIDNGLTLTYVDARCHKRIKSEFKNSSFTFRYKDEWEAAQHDLITRGGEH